jgi:hypothetical protein
MGRFLNFHMEESNLLGLELSSDYLNPFLYMDSFFKKKGPWAFFGGAKREAVSAQDL